MDPNNEADRPDGEGGGVELIRPESPEPVSEWRTTGIMFGGPPDLPGDWRAECEWAIECAERDWNQLLAGENPLRVLRALLTAANSSRLRWKEGVPFGAKEARSVIDRFGAALKGFAGHQYIDMAARTRQLLLAAMRSTAERTVPRVLAAICSSSAGELSDARKIFVQEELELITRDHEAGRKRLVEQGGPDPGPIDPGYLSLAAEDAAESFNGWSEKIGPIDPSDPPSLQHILRNLGLTRRTRRGRRT